MGDAVTLSGQAGPFTPPQIADAVGEFGCCAAATDDKRRTDTRLHAKRILNAFMRVLPVAVDFGRLCRVS
jgi:hypothetical protein